MIPFEYREKLKNPVTPLDISHMKKERNIPALLVGLCGLSTLGWLMHSFAPDGIRISLFFTLVFTVTAAFSFFVARSRRQAVLAGVGVSTLFFLRLIGLREPLYVILLFASLISLEVYLKKR